MADMALFAALFSTLPNDAVIELRVIHPTDGVVGRLFSDDFMQLEDFANEWNGKAHVYFGVAARKRGRESAKKEDIHSANAVWVDVDAKHFDGNKQAAFDAIQRYALPPSFVIDSGRGYHVYWLLDHPHSDVESFEEVTSKLRYFLGADATFDITRILRVPGTLNIKYDPPETCTTIRKRDDIRYSLSDINNAINITPRIVHMINTGDLMDKPSRSERDMAILKGLRDAGVTEPTRKLIFIETPAGSKFRELGKGGDRYFDMTVKRIEELMQSKTRSEQQFTERGDCYFIGDVQVSTFVFEPEKVLRGNIENGTQDVLYGTVRSGGQVWPGVTFDRSAFARLDSLQKALPFMEWSWLGTDKQARFFLPYLVAKLAEKGTPQADRVSVLGRHGDYWVAPTATLTKDSVIERTESPLVWISNTGSVLDIAFDPVADDVEIESLVKQMWPKLSEINLPHVFWPTLGWFMATPFKPLLKESNVRFPLLAIYGTKGAGKTATITEVMQPLIGYTRPMTYDCSATQFSILSLFALTNAIPISLSEFRRSSLGDAKYNSLLRQILLAYDDAEETKGTASQQIKKYPLISPFTMDGEDVVEDPAAKERTVMVRYSPETIREDTSYWHAFREVSQMPLHRFSGRYIQYTLTHTIESVWAVWEEAMKQVNQHFVGNLPDRVRRNMATAYFGIMMFKGFVEKYTEIQIPPPSVLQQSLEEIIADGMDRAYNIVDDLIEDVINHIASGQASDIAWRWEPDVGVLWFHMSPARSWWYKMRRQTGQSILDRAAIKSQLAERDQNTRPGKGQYLVGRKTKYSPLGTHSMYGIDLQNAVDSGLDIPEAINITRVYFDYMNKGGRTNDGVQVPGESEDTSSAQEETMASE